MSIHILPEDKHLHFLQRVKKTMWGGSYLVKKKKANIFDEIE